MTTITLKVPEDLLARLDAAARSQRVSRSEVCRKSLEESLKKVIPTRRSLLERSSDLCGCAESGIKDLSSNPKHLDDFGR
jgi:metal-responsive CopG/Arc/MetJ family transcriptional regulator